MSISDHSGRARRPLALAPEATENPIMTLLERETALAALGEYADAAGAGRGQLVLVVGEAGVGKSALLDQFEGNRAGVDWYWGACDGLFTPRPLGPLFDLADQLGGELIQLVRAGADRDRLFDAVLRQLVESPRPAIAVIEDIHWADEATLDLIRFVARRIRTSTVLLVVTYRDDALDATNPLRRALGELVSPGLSSRVELAPLSIGAVQALADPLGLPADELYRLTAGNPFYLSEVLRSGGDLLSATARDVILARSARLSPAARLALETGALIGSRIDLALLASVADATDPIVDELVGSGLLVADGLGLRFRHEIARLAIELAVPAHRRGDVHRRILAGLLASGCDDEARLAFHSEEAGDGPAVLRHAPLAADRAVELSSHTEAVAQYQRALRFAQLLESRSVARYYDLLVGELSLVDRWPEAVEAGERALELWRAVGDPLREGDTMRRLCKALWRLCRGRDADAAGEAAVALLEPLGPSVELAWAYCALAANHAVNDRATDAIAVARRAQELAVDFGAFAAHSDALNSEACALTLTGGDWLTPLLRGLQVAVEHGCNEQAGRAYTNLYELHCEERRYIEGYRYYEEGVAYSERHDMGTYARCLRGGYAQAQLRTGNWAEVEQASRQLRADCDPSSINRISPLLCLGTLSARRGQPDAAELLDELIVATEGTGEAQYMVPARLARAETYWLQGNTGLAQRQVELADDVCAGSGPWLRGEVAAWLRRVGSARGPRGEIAGPYVAEVAGDWRAAAEQWTDLGCRYDSALALLASDDEAALRSALVTFEDLEASAAARLTRQRMRAVGVRSIPSGRRSSTRAHPLGLTQRECEVLELICDGFTNPEIAAELVISPRTVDHHVSAVLAKLGRPTRNAAAEHAVELGLVAN